VILIAILLFFLHANGINDLVVVLDSIMYIYQQIIFGSHVLKIQDSFFS